MSTREFLPQTRLIVYHADETNAEAFEALKTYVHCGHPELLSLHENGKVPAWNEKVKVLDIQLTLGPIDAEYRTMRKAMLQLGELGYKYELAMCGPDGFETETNVDRPSTPLLNQYTFVGADFDNA